MKIAIIGGHLSPALAVIQKLKKEDIVFIGRRYALEGDKALSFEYKLIISMGIDFVNLKTGRFQRKFTARTIPSLTKIPLGLLQSLAILRRFKPDVVVSFGGYLSVPVITAAYALRIPVVIHEQTFEVGLANRVSAPFATRVCISFESSRKFFPKNKTILTGNPVREEILNPVQRFPLPKGELPLIFVTGGSLGSHFLNSLIEKSLTNLLGRYRIIHQTGNSEEFGDFIRLKSLRESLDEDLKSRYNIYDFLSSAEIGFMLNNADLVISRSGINTVSDLLYLNKKALLFPLSFSQKNEQVKNAMFLAEAGLAEVINTDHVSSEDFVRDIDSMIANGDNYKIKENFKGPRENAAQSVVNVILNVAKKNNNKKTDENHT